MMGGLPERIDPLQLADQQVRLAGRIAVSRMGRLGGMLNNCGGEVDVIAEFGRDELRRPVLHLIAGAPLELICQRCMRPMTVVVEVNTNLALVTNEAEAEQLANRYESILVSAGRTSFTNMVEDELLLRLPMIPRHENDAACIPVRSGDRARTPENPFAVLASLKRDD